MMTPVKIIHTADIHLDSPLKSLALVDEGLRGRVKVATRSAFEKIIDLAIENKVVALLISGDLYDSDVQSAKSVAFLIQQFDRLNQHEIMVFIIKGNHDAISPLSDAVQFPKNVHVFGDAGEKIQIDNTGVWIHGVSFSHRQMPESLLPKFEQPVKNAVNIGMLHTSLGGAEGHDTYAPCSISDLKNMGYDYWALGHIHKRQVHGESPWIVMSGIPQGRHIREAGKKSVTMLTIEGGKISVKEKVTSQIEFGEIEIDITDTADEEALRDRLRKKLQEYYASLQSPNAILRIRLTGGTNIGWKIMYDKDYRRETLVGIAGEIGGLFIEDVDFYSALAKLEATSVSAVDELRALMEKICTESAFFDSHILPEVKHILTKLPAGQSGELLNGNAIDKDKVKRLTQSGVIRMIARMRVGRS